MWAAVAVASLVGIVTFLVWWFTAPPKPPEKIAGAPPAGQTPTRVEFDLPRGGSLAGSLPVDVDPEVAIALLTGAPLFRVNRGTDQLEPWLAASSTATTIKLRPNILRADGSPLTAAEVAAVFNARPPVIAGKPVTARAIDPLTIEIVFPSPFAPGLRVLDAIPIPGCGPFVLTERTPGGRLTFARNSHYWRQAPDGQPLPYLDTLILEAGAGRPDELDFNENVRPADYRALRKADDEGKLRLYDLGPGLEADALWMNLSPAAAGRQPPKPWLRSDAFRQAISTAIDRRELCDIVFAGMCDPIAGPVTPASGAWFMPDLPSGHDAALARATLAGLGLQDRNRDGMLDDDQGRPVRFTLLVPRGRPTIESGAAYLRDELKKIGLAVDVTPIDRSVLESRWEKGDYDAIYDRVPVRDTDPALNLDFWLSSGSRHMWNPRQPKPATDWEAQIDRLMLKQASTLDRIDRVQLFAEVQKVFAEHMPAIYFGAPYVYVATSTRVLNAKPVTLRPAMLWNADVLAAATR